MVDIILVEFRGRAMLVRGERYIDDLLGNTLPADVSIEIMACESESDVNDLWMREEGPEHEGRTPWMIHPGIMRRLKRPKSGHSVFFGQWSAFLDSDAHAVIRAVAAAAEETSDAEVFLISYNHSDEARAVIDLTNLRMSLVEAELADLGVAPARIVREARDPSTDPNTGSGAQRIDVRVGAG